MGKQTPKGENWFENWDKSQVSSVQINSHIYAQVIDDNERKTIVSASTLDKEFKASEKSVSKTELSKIVGKNLAEKALKNKISQVLFDRNGYEYHGRIKALADAAREAGLKF